MFTMDFDPVSGSHLNKNALHFIKMSSEQSAERDSLKEFLHNMSVQYY
jgi:hypothetical protein